MKLITLLFLWIPLLLNAQHLISTAGAEGEGVIWSIGETITTTLSSKNSNRILTQGFLQPSHSSLSGVIHCQSKTVRVYPNPIKDKLFIDTDNQPCSWRLVNLLGKTLDSGVLGGHSHEFIDTNDYTAGHYILTIITAKGLTSTKIIK